MAKITIAGEAVVITSTMKLEDLITIAKYRPDALVLKGGEDGKEPIFAVSVARGGYGDIGKYGASFATESHNDAKQATITITMPPSAAGEDVRTAVAELVGTAIINLNKIEETLPAVLEEIAAEKQEVLSNISVAQ